MSRLHNALRKAQEERDKQRSSARQAPPARLPGAEDVEAEERARGLAAERAQADIAAAEQSRDRASVERRLAEAAAARAEAETAALEAAQSRAIADREAARRVAERIEQDRRATEAARQREAADDASWREAQSRLAIEREAEAAAAERRAAEKDAVRKSRERARQERRPGPSPLFPIGVTIALFLGALAAWHSQPAFQMPARVKVDATALRLDRHLDLDRKPAPSKTPTGTPSP